MLRDRFRSPGAYYGALAALILAAFFPSLHGGLLDYDDPWLLESNTILASGSVAALPQILSDWSPATRLILGAEYLPVRDMSVLLDFALYGKQWWGHHLTSLLWYAGGCVTLLAVFVELMGRNLRSFAAAAWFSLLPVHVENVAWLAGRKDVVGFFFFALGLLAALRLQGALALVATLACALLAVWSKGTYVVFPVIAALLVVVQRREAWRPLAVTASVLSILLVGTAVLLSTRLGASLGLFTPPRTSGPLELLALQGGIVLHYLRSMLFPAGLSIEYPESGFLPPFRVANLVGLGAMGLLLLFGAVSFARGRRLAALGVAIFFTGLLPVAQIAPLQNLVADRYLLVPSIGAALGIVAVLPAGKWADGLLLGWSLLLGLQSFQRCTTFRDAGSLWAEAAALYPDDADLQVRHALLSAKADPQLGPGLLDAVVARFPSDARVLAKAGSWYLEAGDAHTAEPLLRRALAANPDNRQALNNLVGLLSRTGRAQEAMSLAEHLVRIHPLFATGLTSASSAAVAASRPELARAWASAAVELDPNFASAWCNLGSAAYQVGELEEAGEAWTRCSELAPENEYPRRGLEQLRRTQP